MNFKKTLLCGMVSGLLTTSAMAANVGGVVWDADSVFDFSSNSNLIEQLLNPGQDGIFGTSDLDEVNTLNGFGLVTNINGEGAGTFCPSGCELTYEFGGYLVSTVDDTDPANVEIAFTGGFINFYVDSTTAYDNDIKANASDGNLWLSLAGHNLGGGTTLNAVLTSFGAGVDAGDGDGLLDVTGGLAAANFDTNGEAFGSDWVFTSSFQPFPNSGTTAEGFEIFGSADFSGTSIEVPEPSSLALLGLGILGLGFGARRKQK